jgi:hypothetical protein
MYPPSLSTVPTRALHPYEGRAGAGREAVPILLYSGEIRVEIDYRSEILFILFTKPRMDERIAYVINDFSRLSSVAFHHLVENFLLNIHQDFF